MATNSNSKKKKGNKPIKLEPDKMEGELLTLHWTNHSMIYSQAIANLRGKSAYTDATLACDNQFFAVHKFVLSTCSDYFNKIFEHTPCVSPVIVINNINYNDLEALLNFMYVGEVNVTEMQLPGVLKAAEFLGIKGLSVRDDEKIDQNVSQNRNQETRNENQAQSVIQNEDQSDSDSENDNQSVELIQNIKKEPLDISDFERTDYGNKNIQKNVNKNENDSSIEPPRKKRRQQAQKSIQKSSSSSSSSSSRTKAKKSPSSLTSLKAKKTPPQSSTKKSSAKKPSSSSSSSSSSLASTPKSSSSSGASTAKKSLSSSSSSSVVASAVKKSTTTSGASTAKKSSSSSAAAAAAPTAKKSSTTTTTTTTETGTLKSNKGTKPKVYPGSSQTKPKVRKRPPFMTRFGFEYLSKPNTVPKVSQKKVNESFKSSAELIKHPLLNLQSPHAQLNTFQTVTHTLNTPLMANTQQIASLAQTQAQTSVTQSTSTQPDTHTTRTQTHTHKQYQAKHIHSNRTQSPVSLQSSSLPLSQTQETPVQDQSSLPCVSQEHPIAQDLQPLLLTSQEPTHTQIITHEPQPNIPVQIIPISQEYPTPQLIVQTHPSTLPHTYISEPYSSGTQLVNVTHTYVPLHTQINSLHTTHTVPNTTDHSQTPQFIPASPQSSPPRLSIIESQDVEDFSMNPPDENQINSGNQVDQVSSPQQDAFPVNHPAEHQINSGNEDVNQVISPQQDVVPVNSPTECQISSGKESQTGSGMEVNEQKSVLHVQTSDDSEEIPELFNSLVNVHTPYDSKDAQSSEEIATLHYHESTNNLDEFSEEIPVASSSNSDAKFLEKRKQKSSTLPQKRPSSTEDQNHICTLCHKSFEKEWNLTRHLKRHTQPHLCKLCDFVTYAYKELVSHRKEKHQKRKCSYCNFTSPFNYVVVKHEKIHEKTHKCKKCDFTTKKKEELTSHNKNCDGTK